MNLNTHQILAIIYIQMEQSFTGNPYVNQIIAAPQSQNADTRAARENALDIRISYRDTH
jgi:hypothetical protein